MCVLDLVVGFGGGAGIGPGGGVRDFFAARVWVGGGEIGARVSSWRGGGKGEGEGWG